MGPHRPSLSASTVAMICICILYIVRKPIPIWLWPLIRGAAGRDGLQGEKGEKGWPGMRGDSGREGPAGTEKGEKGDHGPKGSPGPMVKFNVVCF